MREIDFRNSIERYLDLFILDEYTLTFNVPLVLYDDALEELLNRVDIFKKTKLSVYEIMADCDTYVDAYADFNISDETLASVSLQIQSDTDEVFNSFYEKVEVSENEKRQLEQSLQKVLECHNVLLSELINFRDNVEAQDHVNKILSGISLDEAWCEWVALYKMFGTDNTMSKNLKFYKYLEMQRYVEQIPDNLVFAITDYAREKEYIKMGVYG